ncbi:hypothetical protein DFR50_101232 [Roseiarcus fermentans]|uniref:Uncharacterized protein n=1 Tax=Roseiarcus fermentans TaxID=1473586 RepID=A0A366FUJ1_9HYPH|nr:hypothetical protein DFR50_101232 [Roseiarcus fermentans]
MRSMVEGAVAKNATAGELRLPDAVAPRGGVRVRATSSQPRHAP